MIRIQRKNTKGWTMPAGAVYVGGGSVWANPFKDGTPIENFIRYSHHMLPYRHRGGTLSDFCLSEANLTAMILDLSGKNLCCWCSLDSPYCHADLLLKWAN